MERKQQKSERDVGKGLVGKARVLEGVIMIYAVLVGLARVFLSSCPGKSWLWAILRPSEQLLEVRHFSKWCWPRCLVSS